MEPRTSATTFFQSCDVCCPTAGPDQARRVEELDRAEDVQRDGQEDPRQGHVLLRRPSLDLQTGERLLAIGSITRYSQLTTNFCRYCVQMFFSFGAVVLNNFQCKEKKGC